MSHPKHKQPALTVELARTAEDVLASQQLRYQVFAREQGALLESEAERVDRDYYDDFCDHLLVREVSTGRVVCSTRILTTPRARDAGSFYSENEFDLSMMFPKLLGNAIEIGRTCVHQDYRNGVGISMLWSGLVKFMKIHKADYLFGCASISMRDGGGQAAALMLHAKEHCLAPEKYRVMPRLRTLPVVAAENLDMPSLLKTYLKLGAWIGGEPCLDPNFNVADFFVLMDVKRLNVRYHQRFARPVELAPAAEARYYCA